MDKRKVRKASLDTALKRLELLGVNNVSIETILTDAKRFEKYILTGNTHQ